MEISVVVVNDTVACLRRIETEASPEWNYTLHLLLSENFNGSAVIFNREWVLAKPSC
jgi:hypothetical protein